MNLTESEKQMKMWQPQMNEPSAVLANNFASHTQNNESWT
jgi:hypothetical protein